MGPDHSTPFDDASPGPKYWSPLLNAVLIVMATAGLASYLATGPSDLSPSTQSKAAYSAEQAPSNVADAT